MNGSLTLLDDNLLYIAFSIIGISSKNEQKMKFSGRGVGHCPIRSFYRNLAKTRTAVTRSVVQHQILNTVYLSCFGQVFVQTGKHISRNCRNMFVQDEKCSYKEALRLSKPQMPHQHHICTQPAQFRLI